MCGGGGGGGGHHVQWCGLSGGVGHAMLTHK